MHMKLLDLDNLAKGSERQRAAFTTLERLGVMERLRSHSPVLTGPWPLGLETAQSPISILCSSENLEAFAEEIERNFGGREGFRLAHEMSAGQPAVTARFHADAFAIEIHAQTASVFMQPAVMLMLLEARLLSFAPSEAREAIRAEIAKGATVEDAFATCFDLAGDARDELLKASRLTDREILSLTHRFRFRPS